MYYKKGIQFEYKVKKILEEYNAYVIRSAKSHTLADLVVLYKNSIKLLQLKKSKKVNHKDIDSGYLLYNKYRVPLYILYKFKQREYELYLSNNKPILLYKGNNIKKAIEFFLNSKFSFVFS